MTACPRCPHAGLRHTLIGDSLPAHTCPSCSGTLIGLIGYRLWRETHKIDQASAGDAGSVQTAGDTGEAISCSKCQSLMTKYRISADAPNRVDFCARCEDIWLDEGEWALVEALAGSDHLANIITQPWQRRVRIATEAQLETERLKTVFGEDYDRVIAFHEWLNAHPDKGEVLAYLLRHPE